MLISKFSSQYTSGHYKFSDVYSELRELISSKSFAEAYEELWDCILAFQLWLHSFGFNFFLILPQSHYFKFEARRQVWELIFAIHDLKFSPKFLVRGGNYCKPEKVSAALQAAKESLTYA